MRSDRYQFRCPKPLGAALEVYAKGEGLGIAEAIRRLIAEGLDVDDDPLLRGFEALSKTGRKKVSRAGVIARWKKRP